MPKLRIIGFDKKQFSKQPNPLMRGKKYAPTPKKKIESARGERLLKMKDPHTQAQILQEIRAKKDRTAGPFIKELLKKRNLSHEIKGTVASKGKGKGTVKLIFNRQQLKDFSEGNVLVAPMTCAWHVPIMQKASAIVTDEGGVSCHAAIISREFNVPCIIGTKNATKVFKDDDMVEVDAEKGIARKV